MVPSTQIRSFQEILNKRAALLQLYREFDHDMGICHIIHGKLDLIDWLLGCEIGAWKTELIGIEEVTP